MGLSPRKVPCRCPGVRGNGMGGIGRISRIGRIGREGRGGDAGSVRGDGMGGIGRIGRISRIGRERQCEAHSAVCSQPTAQIAARLVLHSSPTLP